MKPRPILTALVLSSFALSAMPARAEDKKPAPAGKKTAAELLSSAQESLAYTTKAARNAGQKLSPENAAAKPFLLSLKKINSALDDAGTGLKEKNTTFFKALDAARAGVSEMQATWDLTGSDNKDVIAGAKKLGGDIIALQENYSPIAARRAKGGDLTADEKAKFAKIQSQQSALDKKLAALAAKYSSDKALAAGIKQIRSKTSRIAKAKPSVGSYTGAIDLLSSITGLLSGYTYYVPAAARTEWTTVASMPSTWSYESYYESYSYEWSSVEESVETYDSESIEVSEAEIAQEDSYLEDTNFDVTAEEETEIANESDDVSAEEINSDDMESEQEEVAQEEDEEDMAPADDSDGDEGNVEEGGGDDGGDDNSADDGGGDDGGGGGDDGGGDDGGGE